MPFSSSLHQNLTIIVTRLQFSSGDTEFESLRENWVFRNPVASSILLSSPPRPGLLWSPPNLLLSNGYRRLLPRGVKRPRYDVDHSHPSSAEFKKRWSCTSTPWRRIWAEVWLHAYLSSEQDGGEWSTSRSGSFTPGTHWIGSWVGPRAGAEKWRREKKSHHCPCRKLNPGRSSP
jgi:hypothetical protein